MTTLTRFSILSLLVAVALAGCSKKEEPATEGSAATDEQAAAAQDAAAPVATQQSFAEPAAGFDALVAAIRSGDQAAFASMLGPDYADVIPVGDIDRTDVDKFLAAYDAKHEIKTEAPDNAVLVVGEGWTLPIPLAKDAEGWYFNMDAGEHEIAIRRIGRNELDVIQTALAYYDAQKEYASKDRNGDKLLEYAQKVISTEGQKDGLYWPGEGADMSPLGPLLADDAVPGEPYHGYRYRILTAQGSHAHGGAMSYIIGGRMVGGFGLIAWPAVYADTGIMTFIINHDGKVYQKDLGDGTEAAAAAITTYDPDDTWQEVKPEA